MPTLRIEPFTRTVKILTKTAGMQPFQLNNCQRVAVHIYEDQYRRVGRIRAVILKSRQIGMSTLSEALMLLWCTYFAPSPGIVIAQDSRVARTLLEMTKRMWSTWRFASVFGRPKYATKSELIWDVGSSLMIHSAEKVDATRGQVSRALHCSEVAFWPDPDTLMTGLLQGLPRAADTICLLESTANGVGGYFYEAYQAAKEHESDYVAVFVPWWIHEEYIAWDDPDLGKLSQEEKALVKLMKKGFTYEGISGDVLGKITFTDSEIEAKLKWRRWKIADLQGDEDAFRQEYPATDDEAFVSKGTNVFPIPELQACWEKTKFAAGELVRDRAGKLTFLPRPDGSLRIFKMPDLIPEMTQGYIAAGDPTHAYSRNKYGSDNAIIQVLNRRTYEQVAVWHGMVGPVDLAQEIANIAEFYNWALATCEIEGPGYATIGSLSHLYPYIYEHTLEDRWEGDRKGIPLGWSTNYQRKHLAIGWLKKLVVHHDLLIHDSRTFEEMKNYILIDGEMSPSRRGEHDDHVMSLAIAVACSQQMGVLEPLPTSRIMPRYLQAVGGEEE